MQFKKTIKIPIYNCRVFVYLGTEVSQTYRALLAKFKEEDDEDVAFDGVVMNTPGDPSSYHMLLDTEVITPNLLTHEAVHLAIKILKHRGHDSIQEGEEPLAYLCGFLVEEVYKILIKNNIELKLPKVRRGKKDQDIHSS